MRWGPSWGSIFGLPSVCRAPIQVRYFAYMSPCIYMTKTSITSCLCACTRMFGITCRTCLFGTLLGVLFALCGVSCAPIPVCCFACMSLCMHMTTISITLDVFCVCVRADVLINFAYSPAGADLYFHIYTASSGAPTSIHTSRFIKVYP